ncbi:amidohydrolase [Flavobacterium sp. 14A]|uniref:amidohydrolase n=1 Tax=Flavobacterium sp. 14A TaxID=2735896 RepID=UPI001571418B|nr:amidohydrolase [Flavobacterium sp. 14A]NRT13127.1 putative amidohydrolase [Flavobacterium sp. 14A]
MKVAIIQSALVWENPQANRENFEEKINSIEGAVNLIVLPEMFTSGFTMNPAATAETMTGETVVWMQTLAKANNCAITGSVVIEEEGAFYNRLLFVFPSGELQQYNKRHLFTLAGEEKQYAKGGEKLIVNYMGWRIAPLICYDLRFPVFSRNNNDYDLLLYVANWPSKRLHAWNSLLAARAIENMSYTIGVNRIGLDGNNHDYSGQSQVLDALGYTVANAAAQETVIIVDLDKKALDDARQRFNFLNDRDTFTITH